jgi:deazaflavin-dependent oxidoreductase (nitroreductase family)
VPEVKPASQLADPIDVDGTASLIAARSRSHVELMEAGTDSTVWLGSGMSRLLLITIGRKTGRTHKVALPYWIDDDGERVVVASYGGASQDPAWYLNLTDSVANAQVLIATRDGWFRAQPLIMKESERERVWRELVVDRPHYAVYQARCARRVPLVKLVEIDPR